MPKLATAPDRPGAAHYTELVSSTRRADATTKQQSIMGTILQAVNAALSAARRVGLEPPAPLELPAYNFIKTTILPLGRLGVEDEQADARAKQRGRD